MKFFILPMNWSWSYDSLFLQKKSIRRLRLKHRKWMKMDEHSIEHSIELRIYDLDIN